MCALSFTPYCRGQVSVALGQPIYLRGSRPQRAAAARPPHCPPRRVLQELVPFDIIGELRRTRRLFASSTPKMRSPAANSASINPAASCAHPFPLGCADSFLSISSSNASWSLCCRAIAGVVGRPQCTINDSLSFSRRPARPAHRRWRLATQRKIYNYRLVFKVAGFQIFLTWPVPSPIHRGEIDAPQCA